MTNYPIGDFLIQIKNAALAKRRSVEVDKTKLIVGVAKVLKEEGFLSTLKGNKEKLTVGIVYRQKSPQLGGLKLVSKPGLRIYMGADELAKHRGISFFVVSTPKGIMSSKKAIKKRMGGEVIVEIW